MVIQVEGTFSIAGRGTVVTGRVESGQVRPGDEIEIVGLRKTQKTTVRARSFEGPTGRQRRRSFSHCRLPLPYPSRTAHSTLRFSHLRSPAAA